LRNATEDWPPPHAASRLPLVGFLTPSAVQAPIPLEDIAPQPDRIHTVSGSLSRLSTRSSTSTTEALVTEHFTIHNPTSGSLTRPPHEGSLRSLSDETGAPKNPPSLDRWTLHRLLYSPKADEPPLGLRCRHPLVCVHPSKNITHAQPYEHHCSPLPPRRFLHRIGDRLSRDDRHPMKPDLEALLRSWDQTPGSRCHELPVSSSSMGFCFPLQGASSLP
jgi:hypothetical protein